MAQVLYFVSDELNTIPSGSVPGFYVPVVVDRMKSASIHQITLTPVADSAMTGRIKIGYRATTNALTDGIEFVSDGYGSDLVIDMANGVQTVTFEAAVGAIAITVDTITAGSDIRVGVAGW